jgi:multiple sugar transport system permease protein
VSGLLASPRHAATRQPTLSPTRRPARLSRRAKKRLTVLSFMAPALVGMLVFFGYPLAATVYLSFTRFNLLSSPEWVGLLNYRFALHDPQLRQSAMNTIWLICAMVPSQILFGLGTGMLLTKMRRSGGIYRTIFFLPALVPPVAGALAFVYLLKPGTGIVNDVLSWFGIDGPLWFNSSGWAKPSLTLLGLWGIGNTMLIFLAALLDVPVSLLEAASLDGANAWQRFRHVTLPSLSPVLVFTGVVGVITTLQYFTQAAVAASAASGQATVGGGVGSNFGYPNGSTFTYPLWLYMTGFRYGFLGYASALAVLLFVVAFAVIAFVLKRSRSVGGGS